MLRCEKTEQNHNIKVTNWGLKIVAGSIVQTKKFAEREEGVNKIERIFIISTTKKKKYT
jgi:hypothetical protein